MTDWLSTVDRIDNFHLRDACLDAWNRWYQQFKVILLASSFDGLPNTQRVALLMMKCKGFQPAWEVLEIDVDGIEYDDFVSNMIQYLNPTNARRVLSMRKQRVDESFDRFADDLEALSRPCRYSDEKILRDFFILNMHPSHSKISDAICRRYDVSFEEAVSMAKSMVPQECFPEEMERSRVMYGFSSPRTPSLLGKDTSSIVNIRMMPIKSGTHEVQILNIDPTDKRICQVCSTSMLDARTDFLLFFNEWMKNCQDQAVTPTVGCKYAALMKCKWYRVDVLSVEQLQKKARVLAIDFGWISTAQFSVFRNLPLDFRPPAPLLWTVSFHPMPLQVEQGAILKIHIEFVDSNWVASLIPGMNSNQQPFMPNDDVKHSGMFPTPSGYDKPRNAASDSKYQKHRTSQVDGVEKTQRRGRTSNPSDQIMSKSKTTQNGRVSKEALTSSDTENSQETTTNSVDSSRTSRTRDLVQRSDRLGVDNKSEGRSRNNKNDRFNRGHFNRRQRFGYHTDSASGPSSAGKPVESVNHNANKRFDRGNNVSNLNDRQQFSFYPGPTSTPNSADKSFDRSINGNVKRQENSATLSSTDNSLESSNLQCSNDNYTRNSITNINGRQQSTFQREPGNNLSLTNNNKSRPASDYEPRIVRRSVELQQACRDGTRNRDQSDRKPASSKKPGNLPVSRPQNVTERQIPLGSYIKVHLVDRSPDGEILYCVVEDFMSEFIAMTEKLTKLEKLEPLDDPQEGGLCLARDDDGNWCRAEITRVHPSGERVKLRFLDFGNKDKKKVSDIRVLPEEFCHIQAYAFRVEVPSKLAVDPIQDVEVMAVSRKEDGVWKGKIRIDGVEVESPVAASPVTAHPVGAPPAALLTRTSSARSMTAAPPPRPLHPPPIPRNTFTDVKIVHVGPEGTFAVDNSKIGRLGDIQSEINSVALTPLEGVPKLNQLYAAPFDGQLFRAKVLEVQPNKCLILFVDFGNEAEIPIRDMKCIPEKLCENSDTFKLRLDPRSEVKVQSGMDLAVSPVVYSSDGSWLVQLKGEPSPGPDHSLPDDDLS